MSELVEKAARAMCIANGVWPDGDMPNDGPRWKYWEPNARAAIAAVAEFLCLEAARSASPAQAHEYLSATLLKKQLETPK